MSCLKNDVKISFGGFDWDGCIYEDVEMIENATVIVSRCTKCGKEEIGWIRQENTIIHDLTKEDGNLQNDEGE